MSLNNEDRRVRRGDSCSESTSAFGAFCAEGNVLLDSRDSKQHCQQEAPKKGEQLDHRMDLVVACQGPRSSRHRIE